MLAEGAAPNLQTAGDVVVYGHPADDAIDVPQLTTISGSLELCTTESALDSCDVAPLLAAADAGGAPVYGEYDTAPREQRIKLPR